MHGASTQWPSSLRKSFAASDCEDSPVQFVTARAFSVLYESFARTDSDCATGIPSIQVLPRVTWFLSIRTPYMNDDGHALLMGPRRGTLSDPPWALRPTQEVQHVQTSPAWSRGSNDDSRQQLTGPMMSWFGRPDPPRPRPPPYSSVSHLHPLETMVKRPGFRGAVREMPREVKGEKGTGCTMCCTFQQIRER